MASPVDFEGRNAVYTAEDCLPLPVYRKAVLFQGGEALQVVSAWQLTPEELKRVNESGGIVFLSIIGGQPPVNISGFPPEME